MTQVLGTNTVLTTIGTVTIRAFDLSRDVGLVHSWVTHPRSKFWGALKSTLEEVREEYRRIALSAHEAAWILELDGQPLALSETYDPAFAVLDSCTAITHEDGDIGLHFLVSPPNGEVVHNLSRTLFSALLRWIFSHPSVSRIIVEPDQSNHAVLTLNARAGFRQPGRRTVLATATGIKQAIIQVCHRLDFEQSPLAFFSHLPHLQIADRHPAALNRIHSDTVHRSLIAKAIREFTHERLVKPYNVKNGTFVSEIDFSNDNVDEALYEVSIGSLSIRFLGRLYALLHLDVDPSSIHIEGTPEWQPDVLAVIAEAASDFNLASNHLHTYLNELSSTFAARLRAFSVPRPCVGDLTDPDRDPVEAFLAIESAMTEGHPSFLANAGRNGLGEFQSHEWVPELGSSTTLVWCASLRERTIATSTSFDTSDELINIYFPWFTEALAEAGLNPRDYVPIAFHPWQWEHIITSAFSRDITSHRLVYLGQGEDLFRPTQSFRTFFNASHPERPYIKTAVGIRNMGFTRGLSAEYMQSTPAVNDWIRSTIEGDEELANNSVGFLYETFTCSYVGDVYHASTSQSEGSSSPYLKMTSMLLRQSPFSQEVTPPLRPGESVTTLAALLHRDPLGQSMVSSWIAASHLDPESWLDRLLRVYFRPLVHLLFTYKLVLMPHTENVILRLHQGCPVGVYHKDLGEEVAVLSRHVSLPEHLHRLYADVGEDSADGLKQQALSIHTDVIDGVLRHLAVLMVQDGLITQSIFWERVRCCLDDYGADYPSVMHSGLWQALRAPRFKHSTLNRLQLRNPETMVDISDQESSLIYAGTLLNPLAVPYGMSK